MEELWFFSVFNFCATNAVLFSLFWRVFLFFCLFLISGYGKEDSNQISEHRSQLKFPDMLLQQLSVQLHLRYMIDRLELTTRLRKKEKVA